MYVCVLFVFIYWFYFSRESCLLTLLTFILRLWLFLFLPSCHSPCLYLFTLFIFPVPHKASASMCFPCLASVHPTPGTGALVHFCNKGLLLSPGHQHWLFSLGKKLCARVSLGWQFTGMLLEESAPPDTLSAFPKVLTTSPLVAYFRTIILQPSIFFYLFICLV